MGEILIPRMDYCNNFSGAIKESDREETGTSIATYRKRMAPRALFQPKCGVTPRCLATRVAESDYPKSFPEHIERPALGSQASQIGDKGVLIIDDEEPRSHEQVSYHGRRQASER